MSLSCSFLLFFSSSLSPSLPLQVKVRAKEVGEAFDLLKFLNDGGEVRNMLGGNYDFSQFKGRLNMNQAAVIGHSFGGGTVIQTLYQDERFK